MRSLSGMCTFQKSLPNESHHPIPKSHHPTRVKHLASRICSRVPFSYSLPINIFYSLPSFSYAFGISRGNYSCDIIRFPLEFSLVPVPISVLKKEYVMFDIETWMRWSGLALRMRRRFSRSRSENLLDAFRAFLSIFPLFWCMIQIFVLKFSYAFLVFLFGFPSNKRDLDSLGALGLAYELEDLVVEVPKIYSVRSEISFVIFLLLSYRIPEF